MIRLLNAPTPNGRKAFIMLEETGLPYRLEKIDIGKGDQFKAGFLAVSPNNKIPAIIDQDAEGGPVALFESGAILVYLADKSGRFLPASGVARYEALAWTFWQVGGPGPMFGQLGYFAGRAPEKHAPTIARFVEESHRLLGVMEARLAASAFVGGRDYGIADIACYAWTVAAATRLRDMAPGLWGDFPAIAAWLKTVGARPAVVRAMADPPPEGSQGVA